MFQSCGLVPECDSLDLQVLRLLPHRTPRFVQLTKLGRHIVREEKCHHEEEEDNDTTDTPSSSGLGRAGGW